MKWTFRNSGKEEEEETLEEEKVWQEKERCTARVERKHLCRYDMKVEESFRNAGRRRRRGRRRRIISADCRSAQFAGIGVLGTWVGGGIGILG